MPAPSVFNSRTSPLQVNANGQSSSSATATTANVIRLRRTADPTIRVTRFRTCMSSPPSLPVLRGIRSAGDLVLCCLDVCAVPLDGCNRTWLRGKCVDRNGGVAGRLEEKGRSSAWESWGNARELRRGNCEAARVRGKPNDPTTTRPCRRHEESDGAAYTLRPESTPYWLRWCPDLRTGIGGAVAQPLDRLTQREGACPSGAYHRESEAQSFRSDPWAAVRRAKAQSYAACPGFGDGNPPGFSARNAGKARNCVNYHSNRRANGRLQRRFRATRT